MYNNIIKSDNITIHSEYNLLKYYLSIMKKEDFDNSLLLLNEIQWNNVKDEINKYHLEELSYPDYISNDYILKCQNDFIKHNRYYNCINSSPLLKLNPILFNINVNSKIISLNCKLYNFSKRIK